MKAKLLNRTLGKVQQRNSSSGLIRLAILFHETMKAEGMVIVILVPCVRRTRSQQQYYYYGLVVRRSKKRALNLSKKFHQKPLLKAKRRREREGERTETEMLKKDGNKRRGTRCIQHKQSYQYAAVLAWDESYFLIFDHYQTPDFSPDPAYFSRGIKVAQHLNQCFE